ncbi:MAG TPA: DUF1156 domain-containing protein [Acetobacteraceae bacterium]|nr:DUF1156 domain-containing protein [Acetobacteraceae bacterium]
MVEQRPCRKLIEVSIPLEAINAAAAREKSIRHGHPSTLHLWWARRPLAACRAVLFAQLVDDPSSWPDRFPGEAAQETERRRLHELIARLTPWEAAKDATILNEARWEIARSVAWGRGEEPPPAANPDTVRSYLLAYAPPVRDPFCGGGSTLLEAQRLGLRVFGSDLNPVATLISKALVEVPPRFCGQAPVNPQSRDRPELVAERWTAARSLADDVRYYGRWIRAEAERRIGHLYPKATLPDGREATVVAWLWARTVRSPDPAAKAAHVPLVSTFMLSTKKRQQAWIEPKIDRTAATYEFTVHGGTLPSDQAARAKQGTKTSRGASFRCLLTGSPISAEWIKREGKAGRMRYRLLALAVEGEKGRRYLASTEFHATVAEVDRTELPELDQKLPRNPRWFAPPDYGYAHFKDLFTPRQLVALATFSDLVQEARKRVEHDAVAAGLASDAAPLNDGGEGASAYADAVATYLAFALSKLADRGSSICTWFTERDSTRPTFARQAIQMTWDFAELNMLLHGTGSFAGAVEWTAESLEGVPDQAEAGVVRRQEAAQGWPAVHAAAINTDPPYYDNIGYADLSDFFYVWLRRTLGAVWTDLLATAVTPKDAELVATPYRHGGKAGAAAFFNSGMSRALQTMQQSASQRVPLAIYYAFKQSEAGKDGIASPGWASFLQAVADSGLSIVGTWPLRTELANRMIGMGTNALASSIVLVCRRRAADSPVIERETFMRALRRELPDAVAAICAAGIGPVDLAQSAIGPGMAAFTRHAAVLEYSGEKMSVRTALALINQVLDDTGKDDDAGYDLPTRFALDWFAESGWEAQPSGQAILVANARNLALTALIRGGLVIADGGRTRLVRREEMPRRGTAFNRPATIWQAAQQLARALIAEDGGYDSAARVMARLGNRDTIRGLAYRLYGLCDRRGWVNEALVWNRLAEEWRSIADRAETRTPIATPDLFEMRA